MNSISQPKIKKRKKIKKLTKERLEFLALRYVGRYAATQAMLERVLDRHIQKSVFAHPDFSKSEANGWKNTLLTKAVEKKWVDDAGLAKRFVENGKMSGLSKNKMQQKLMVKGVQKNLIEETFLEAAETRSFDELDFEAAQIYAKKKRLGPYGRDKNADPKKELAKLCRAGFSFDIALKTLKMTLDDE